MITILSVVPPSYVELIVFCVYSLKKWNVPTKFSIGKRTYMCNLSWNLSSKLRPFLTDDTEWEILPWLVPLSHWLGWPITYICKIYSICLCFNVKPWLSFSKTGEVVHDTPLMLCHTGHNTAYTILFSVIFTCNFLPLHVPKCYHRAPLYHFQFTVAPAANRAHQSSTYRMNRFEDVICCAFRLKGTVKSAAGKICQPAIDIYFSVSFKLFL